MRAATLACSNISANKTVFRAAAFWLALAVLTSGAVAQQSPQTQRISPQQIERQIDATDVERRRNAKPAPTIRGVAAPRSVAGNAPKFVLNSVSVEGAAAFSDEEIAGAYRDYLGRSVSQEDLQNIATAISDLYRRSGFHLSRAIVPPQDIKGGQLRILVIEGAIADVKIKGSEVGRFGLAGYFTSLLSEHPSRLRTVERSLLLANDLPGVRISDAAFEEIGTASGRFRLIVSAETWRIFGTVGVDNSGTYAVGPLQAYSSLYLNSALIAGDALGVSVSTIPDSAQDLRYGRASYDTPVGDNGARIGASGSVGEVRPDNAGRLFEARTTSEAFELRGSIVPLQARDTSLTFAVALGLIDETGEDTSGVTYKDRVRTVSLAADYKLQDRFEGWNYLTLGLKQGLDAFGATTLDDPLSSRANASPDFTAYSFAYTRYQPLFDAWSVKGQILGQLSSGPLFNSQAFYLGNAGFGPGYYTGDNGVSGSLELRFSQTANLQFLKSYQLYASVDGGSVWNGSYAEKASLASAGFGVRVEFPDEWRGSVGFAVPISYSSKSDEFRSSRVLFSLSKSFKLCPSGVHMRCPDGGS